MVDGFWKSLNEAWIVSLTFCWRTKDNERDRYRRRKKERNRENENIGFGFGFWKREIRQGNEDNTKVR